MVFFNYALRKLNAKIVYYGPGLCGKTTNLQWIHDHFEGGQRGKMISLATEGDRTIFFDLLPLEIGTIRGMEVTLQLYTVPGQVHYNSTRQLVLRGADGVVFVADSQRTMQKSNEESLRNLQENLLLQGIEIKGFPHVLQFNKRDLRDLLSIEELDEQLNIHSCPIFEAVATEGVGVQETLEGIVKLVMRSLRERYEPITAGGPRPAAAPAPPGGQRPAAPAAPRAPVAPAAPVPPRPAPPLPQAQITPPPARGAAPPRAAARPPAPAPPRAPAAPVAPRQPVAAAPPPAARPAAPAAPPMPPATLREPEAIAFEAPSADDFEAREAPPPPEEQIEFTMEEEECPDNVSTAVFAKGSGAPSEEAGEEEPEIGPGHDQAMPDVEFEPEADEPGLTTDEGFEALESPFAEGPTSVSQDDDELYGGPAEPEVGGGLTEEGAERVFSEQTTDTGILFPDDDAEVLESDSGVLGVPGEEIASPFAEVGSDASQYVDHIRAPSPFAELPVDEHDIAAEPFGAEASAADVEAYNEVETPAFGFGPGRDSDELSGFDAEAAVGGEEPAYAPAEAEAEEEDAEIEWEPEIAYDDSDFARSDSGPAATLRVDDLVARALGAPQRRPQPAAPEVRPVAPPQPQRPPASSPVMVSASDEPFGDPFSAADSEAKAVPLAPRAPLPSPHAIDVRAQDNQLALRLHGTGAIAESGQVRALDIEVPVPGSWVGNRRVTLQLRLTLLPASEDEDDGFGGAP